MPITLNGLALDDMLVSVREQHEEVGGSDARRIELAGVILGESSVAAIETRLDALLDAGSAADYSAVLSLRPGRRLLVRRAAFRREIERTSLTGSFTLRLEARNPYEESAEIHEIPWSIAESPSSQAVTAGGMAEALPAIRVIAADTLIRPGISDGARCIEYDGAVAAGETLEFDAAAAKVYFESEDVTPYTLGQFPRLVPGENVLTYTDGADSSHQAEALVTFRDRWW